MYKKNTPFRLLALLSLVLIIVTFLSCNGKQQSIEFEQIESKVNLLEQINQSNHLAAIGIAHNDMVDLVLKDQIELLRSSEKPSEEEIYKSIRSNIYQLLSTQEFSGFCLRIDEENQISQEEFNKIYDSILLANKSTKTEESRIYNKSDEKHLTKQQLDLLNELDAIMQDDDSSIDSILARILEVQNKAKNSLTNEDLNIVLSTISVAANTCSYWHHYFSKDNLRAKINWKHAGKKDIACCVGAATAVGIRILFTGPIGWKLAAGLIVGTAVGGSVTSVVSDCLS